MLTVSKIKALKPSKYNDGRGLYLKISSANRGKWTFRYMIKGKSREMGFGSYPEVSLAEARDKREAQRKVLAKGFLDPLEELRQAEALKAEKDSIRFSQAAEMYIDENHHAWKNPKHAQQWANTLKTYAYPILDQKPLSEITNQDVLRVLKPIWTTKNETARRVQQRLNRVFS